MNTYEVVFDCYLLVSYLIVPASKFTALITWNKFCSQSGMIKNEKCNSVHTASFKSTLLRKRASEVFI